MATIVNNGSQVVELSNSVGSALLLVQSSWTLTNASHVANKALTVIDTAAGVTRVGYTSKLVELTLKYSVTSGTPAPKGMIVYFLSKVSIPATAPVANTNQVWAQGDVPYILSAVTIADADWFISDTIATVTKEVNRTLVNQDATPGTTIYTFVLNNATTWTPASGSKLDMNWAVILN